MKNGDTQSRQRQPPGSLASETIRNKRPPGADISFSISRAPIGNPLPVPLLFSPFGNPLSSAEPPLGVIFLSHIPNCAFITFKRDWRSRWCGRSPLLRPFFSSVPFSFFFVTGRRMQKREGSSRASLETGSPAAPPRAITLPHGISPFVRWWRRWSVPLCSTLRCTFLSPSSSSTAIGRCTYAPVCFTLMIHHVFYFKSPLHSQTYVSIYLITNLIKYLYTFTIHIAIYIEMNSSFFRY